MRYEVLHLESNYLNVYWGVFDHWDERFIYVRIKHKMAKKICRHLNKIEEHNEKIRELWS
jgi:hypothetical protein